MTDPATALSDQVGDLVYQFCQLWWQCPTGPAPLGPVYSIRTQVINEKHLQRLLNGLYTEMASPPQTASERLEAQERLIALGSYFAKAVLGLEGHHIQALRSYGFFDVTNEFAEMARRFDRHVSVEDIAQASRNVWSMNLVQLLLDRPVEITPAVFAYSMLYPYTDNYLDDPAISPQEKAGFNERFRRLIAGEQLTLTNPLEGKICALIGKIEDQFPRSDYPQVYASLLAIHQAQTKSVSLLRREASPYEVDVLGLCFEKGGASVLADGYLVAGDLTPAQSEFMFYYGTFTQLVDDLQDVEHDLAGGILTVFSQTARRWPLDAITNRTIHFGFKVLEAMRRFNSPHLEPLKEMIRTSLVPLLIDTASANGRYYTRPYLRQLQNHFPFRFTYLHRQRKQLYRRRASLLDLMEAFLPSPR